jgi:tryptophan synthase alpha chain
MAINRIHKCFLQLAIDKSRAFIPYIMGGDPDLDTSLAIMHTLADNGADIIEVGFAFSDPSADGPVIQLAHERVLQAGMSLPLTLELIEKFRQKNNTTAIVLMGYLNPVLAMGYPKFVSQLASSGVDGVLIVDLPVQDSQQLTQLLKVHNILSINFITPTTSDERIESIAKIAQGYIYYVAVKGITGAAHLQVGAVKNQLDKIAQHTNLPLAIGFGIKDVHTAIELQHCGEGIIVGTVIVDLIAEQANNVTLLLAELSKLAREFTKVLKHNNREV